MFLFLFVEKPIALVHFLCLCHSSLFMIVPSKNISPSVLTAPGLQQPRTTQKLTLQNSFERFFFGSICILLPSFLHFWYITSQCEQSLKKVGKRSASISNSVKFLELLSAWTSSHFIEFKFHQAWKLWVQMHIEI